jgi:hypothetical protein
VLTLVLVLVLALTWPSMLWLLPKNVFPISTTTYLSHFFPFRCDRFLKGRKTKAVADFYTNNSNSNNNYNADGQKSR